MIRRARMRAGTIATVVGLVAPLLAGAPAGAAAGSGGRVELVPFANLQAQTDTRPGPPVTNLVLPSSALLNVTVTDVTVAGQVFVHPCASAPTLATPAVFQTRPGETMANTVITGPDATCLTSTTPVSVLTSTRAAVRATPQGGSQYVALPLPVDLPIPFAVDGEAVLALPAGVPVDAVGTVLGITVAAVDDPGFVLVHPCGEQRPFVSDLPTGPTPTGAVVITPLSAAGAATQCVYAKGRTVVQVTVLGYLQSSGPDTTSVPPTLHWDYKSVPPPGLDALTPTRVLDTREPIGTPFAAKVGAGHVQHLDLAPFVTFQTTAVVLNVTVTDPESSGYVTVYPCDEDRPTASNLNYVKGQTVPNLVTVALAADASVCLYSQATTNVVADITATYEFGAGDGAMAVPPARVLDTRLAVGVPAAGKRGAGDVLRLEVAGHGGVPTSGASAVTMNVTVTDPEADGYATVYPCDAPKRPTASNLNYVTGQTVPNAVTVKLSAAGEVCIYTQSAANLVADVNAWFGPHETPGFEEITPDRALDTRPGAIGSLSPSGPLLARQPSGITLAGTHGVPHDATAVVLNVTVVDPAGAGFLTVYPCDTTAPTASNVNFVAHQTVPNQVTVRLGAGADGADLCFFGQHRTDVVVDVAGYYTDRPEAGWVPDVG